MAGAAKKPAAAAKAAVVETGANADPVVGAVEQPELQPGQAAVVARTARFCRAGMCFTDTPTVLVIAELPEGVFERLQAEPNLVVTLVA